MKVRCQFAQQFALVAQSYGQITVTCHCQVVLIDF